MSYQSGWFFAPTYRVGSWDKPRWWWDQNLLRSYNHSQDKRCSQQTNRNGPFLAAVHAHTGGKAHPVIAALETCRWSFNATDLPPVQTTNLPSDRTRLRDLAH